MVRFLSPHLFFRDRDVPRLALFSETQDVRGIPSQYPVYLPEVEKWSRCILFWLDCIAIPDSNVRAPGRYWDRLLLVTGGTVSTWSREAEGGETWFPQKKNTVIFLQKNSEWWLWDKTIQPTDMWSLPIHFLFWNMLKLSVSLLSWPNIIFQDYSIYWISDFDIISPLIKLLVPSCFYLF